MIVLITQKNSIVPELTSTDVAVLIGDALLKPDLHLLKDRINILCVLQSSIDQGYPLPDNVELKILGLAEFAELTEQHEQTISV